MIQRNFSPHRLEILAQIRLAAIGIERRPAAAGCDVIQPARATFAVFVALDPVLV